MADNFNETNSFYGLEKCKQQRIYIPAAVRYIIMNDKDNFGYKFAAMGSFINVLLINLIKYSDMGAIRIKRLELEKHYFALIKMDCCEEKMAAKIAQRLANERVKEIKEHFGSIPKSELNGSSFQLTLNKELKELLSISEEAQEYDCSIKDYLEMVLREYSEKTYIERERMFFYKTIDDLEMCIKRKTVRLVSRDIQFYFRPYKIASDPRSQCNYVLGYSRKVNINEDVGETSDFDIRPFRIDGIRDLTVTNLFSDADYEQESVRVLENYAQHNGLIQHSSGDLIKVTVKFTDEGERERKGIRNSDLKEWVCVSDEEHRFSFEASEFQACNYLRRLSGEFEVISPLELRKTMHDIGMNMAKRNK